MTEEMTKFEKIEAFNEGEYELDDDEGFWCEECGWRGMMAPMIGGRKSGDPIVECPECEEPSPQTGGYNDDKTGE